MSVRRAMVQTLAARQFGLLVRAAGMVVLARLLVPEDFGLFATASAVMALAATVVEFGLSAFLVQARDPGRETVRAAVGLSLTLALAVVAAVGAGLALLPDALWPPGTRPVVALLALGLLVQPAMLPVVTALQRDLRFGLLSVLSLVQVCVNAGVAIGLAAAGLGAAALAAGVAAETAVAALVLAAVAGRGRLVRPSFRGWRALSGFGLRFSSSSLLGNTGEMLVVVIIGRLLGLDVLGQFNRAQTVIKLFDRSLLEGIAPVVLPALSRSLHDGRDPAAVYLTKVAYLAALCWPAFAVMALLAEPLVALLLGPQWQQTVPAVRILALSGLFLPLTKMSMKLFVALGIEGRYLRLQATHQIIRVLLVAGGALVSFEAACLGIALAYGVKALLVTPALKAATGYRGRDLCAVAARCAAVAACATAGPALLLAAAPALTGFPLLASALALAGLGWLAGIAATRHPLLSEILAVARIKDRTRTPFPLTSNSR